MASGAAATGRALHRTLSLTRKPNGAAAGPYYFDPLSDPRWPGLVECNPRASVFHSTNWLRALRDVYGYEPVVATTCPEESPLTNGIVFCRVKSWMTGNRLVSLPFSDHCEPLFDRRKDLDTVLTALREEVNEGKWKYIEIRPIAYEPDCHAGLNRLITYCFHSLDLRSSLEQLFRSLHKDCVQRKIRRAQKENLQYEEGSSESLLQKFYALLVMTRRRQYVPPQPFAWFRGLVDAFGPDIKIRLASKDGVPIASILTLSHKKSMAYKYGCSNVAFNNLGGTALLFWKTIQEAKERGFEELELGRSDAGNAGLIAFKDRWGASRRSITYWTYPPGGESGPGVLSRKVARRVVPMVPDVVLKGVGQFLYKHIG